MQQHFLIYKEEGKDKLKIKKIEDEAGEGMMKVPEVLS